MLIDCDTCAVRGAACSGCLVSALTEASSPLAGLTGEEARVIEAFTRAGFDVDVLESPAAVPLRLVTRRAGQHVA